MKSIEKILCNVFRSKKTENEEGKMHFLTWYRPPLYDLEQAYDTHRLKLPGKNTMPPFAQ